MSISQSSLWCVLSRSFRGLCRLKLGKENLVILYTKESANPGWMYTRGKEEAIEKEEEIGHGPLSQEEELVTLLS